MNEEMGRVYGEIAISKDQSARSIREDLKKILEKSSFKSTSPKTTRADVECFKVGDNHAYIIFRIEESGASTGRGLPEEQRSRTNYKAISIHMEGPKEDPYFMNAARDLGAYLNHESTDSEGGTQ